MSIGRLVHNSYKGRRWPTYTHGLLLVVWLLMLLVSLYSVTVRNLCFIWVNVIQREETPRFSPIIKGPVVVRFLMKVIMVEKYKYTYWKINFQFLTKREKKDCCILLIGVGIRRHCVRGNSYYSSSPVSWDPLFGVQIFRNSTHWYDRRHLLETLWCPVFHS